MASSDAVMQGAAVCLCPPASVLAQLGRYSTARPWVASCCPAYCTPPPITTAVHASHACMLTALLPAQAVVSQAHAGRSEYRLSTKALEPYFGAWPEFPQKVRSHSPLAAVRTALFLSHRS